MNEIHGGGMESFLEVYIYSKWNCAEILGIEMESFWYTTGGIENEIIGVWKKRFSEA